MDDVKLEKPLVNVIIPSIECSAYYDQQEGNYRNDKDLIKKHGKLISWQSQSSSDIRTTPSLRSSAEPPSGKLYIY